VLVACADYFLEGLALGIRLGERLQALSALPPLCWYSWVLLGTWPALGALGTLAQWKLMTEERGCHTNGELVLWYRPICAYLCPWFPNLRRGKGEIHLRGKNWGGYPRSRGQGIKRKLE
jgi:hypothetical protein